MSLHSCSSRHCALCVSSTLLDGKPQGPLSARVGENIVFTLTDGQTYFAQVKDISEYEYRTSEGALAYKDITSGEVIS